MCKSLTPQANGRAMPDYASHMIVTCTDSIINHPLSTLFSTISCFHFLFSIDSLQISVLDKATPISLQQYTWNILNCYLSSL